MMFNVESKIINYFHRSKTKRLFFLLLRQLCCYLALTVLLSGFDSVAIWL